MASQVGSPKQPLPGLFGIDKSNKDFTKKENWGKNTFNNAFPVALANYMERKGIDPVFLSLNEKGQVKHSYIKVKKLFGKSPESSELKFDFEVPFSPYEKFCKGSPPKTDLVVFDVSAANSPLMPLEIKLTALPDNSTAESSNESDYGSELVIRPDTIVYAALALASRFSEQKEDLKKLLAKGGLFHSNIKKSKNLIASREKIYDNLDEVLLFHPEKSQMPLLLQPIWKTKGKQLYLVDKCFDIFVWSETAFAKLLLDRAEKENKRKENVGRHLTSLSWLYHMLKEYSEFGRADFDAITRDIVYDTRNDKAFSANGKVTNFYMKSEELTSPRIPKEATREIILGGGQKLLSPERRLDAAILGTPGLFD